MIRVLVVTVSDSTVAGTREDRSGPAVAARVEQLGWHVTGRELVPDDSARITELLKNASSNSRADVILTTGGTGVAARDVTPEATRAAIDREIPGLPETMRYEGRKQTYLAPLSRAVAARRSHAPGRPGPAGPAGGSAEEERYRRHDASRHSAHHGYRTR